MTFLTDHTPAILKDFRLDFISGGNEYVEPAYADVIECPGSEVHGTAILLDKEAEAKMDRQEGAGFVYEKKAVELEAYDDRKLKASIICSYRNAFSGWTYAHPERELQLQS